MNWLLNGYEGVQMKMTAGLFGGSGVGFNPTLHVGLNLLWTLTDANPAVYPLTSPPQDGFSDLGPSESIGVSIDDGSLVDGVIGPIVNQLKQVTIPLQPVVSLLEAPLPGPVRPEREGGQPQQRHRPLAVARDSHQPAAAEQRAVGFHQRRRHDQRTRPNVPSGGKTDIQFGSFDVRDPRMTAPGAFPPVIMQNEQPGQPVQDLLNLGGNEARFYNAITSLGVQIPLMTSPDEVFGMVLGSPITVLSYKLPTVLLDQSFSQDFPVWVPPPISVHLEVDLQFQAGATIAFTTAPLIEAAATGGQPVNPLDGFEIRDGLVDGDGQPATVHVGIQATAGPAIGIPDFATLSVNGQVNGDVWLRLANTDGDGWVSGSTLANENAIFLTSGTIDGGINADLKLSSQEFANTVSWLGPIGQAVSSWVYKDYTLFQSPMVELANFNTDSDDHGYGRVLGVNISSVAAASEARADGLALGAPLPVDRSDETGQVSDPAPSNLLALASALMTSTPAYARLVSADYQLYLNRPASATDASNWAALLASGKANDDTLVTLLVGGQEFANDVKGTANNFVVGAYEALDGRKPTPAELAYYVPLVSSGKLSHTALTSALDAGTEHRQVEVQMDYLYVLGRHATAAEQRYWATASPRA